MTKGIILLHLRFISDDFGTYLQRNKRISRAFNLNVIHLFTMLMNVSKSQILYVMSIRPSS